MSVMMKRISLARYREKKKSVAAYIQNKNVDVVVYGLKGPVALLMSSSVRQGHRHLYDGPHDDRTRRRALATRIRKDGAMTRRIFNRGGVWSVDSSEVGLARRKKRGGEPGSLFSLGRLWDIAKVSGLLFFLGHK